MHTVEFKHTEKTIELPSGTIAKYVEFDVLKDGESIGTNYMFDDSLTYEQIDELDAAIGKLRDQHRGKMAVLSAQTKDVAARIMDLKIWGVLA